MKKIDLAKCDKPLLIALVIELSKIVCSEFCGHSNDGYCSIIGDSIKEYYELDDNE